MILTLDSENTISNKGNPFDQKNKNVLWGIKRDNEETSTFSSYPSQEVIDEAELLVFFNAKYDIHWLNKAGISVNHKRIWCCQVAEFLLNNMKTPYPSLEDTSIKYNLGHKLDIIKTEYWDKGIDTDQIPLHILSAYCKQDVDLTYSIYQIQKLLFTDKLSRLFSLQMQDLLILCEMEQNGLYYDEKLIKTRSEEIENKIQDITSQLQSVYPDVPLNFASNDHLSAFLYGGTITETIREPIGVFKSGDKIGQTRYKKIEIEHQLPRMYTPLKGTEMAKEGNYSTAEETLKQLKGKQKWISLILELAKLEKLLGTYYKGLPKLNEKMNWSINKLHGQYNQVRAATGRLSSSSPNMQNFSGDTLDIFISQYGN